MANIHMIIGSLVLLAFLLSAILNLLTLFTRREYSWQRGVSFGAATLLLLQYMLGFSLLGSGNSVTSAHFLVALLALVPVGFEHGYASTRDNPKQRALFGAIANIAAFVLVLIAYLIGQSN